MSLDQSHYDVAIFSTGLTQSILSAALASAGLSVIHIDKNDYYADQWASLTLSELLRWADGASIATSSGSKQKMRRVVDVKLIFHAHDANAEQKPGEPSKLPESLASLDRHYAISLAPTLLPATGPSIDCLISSKVSSYATFRLLERTCVASAAKDDAHRMTLTSVPASKEDIFKTKRLSLIAKRKLMKLLMYIGTEDWQTELAQDPATAQRPFIEYLAEVHKMPSDLVDAVAYGVCLCATPHETTQSAMARAKSHMQSVGRYGNSAYLVGQYGGAGELAQGYCRASAVKGGMFILDHRIQSLKRDDSDTKWEIKIDGIETDVTADFVVSSEETLDELGVESTYADRSISKSATLYRAVLVLDKPILFTPPNNKESTTSSPVDGDTIAQEQVNATEPPPETGLIVFPPGSVGGNANTVTVLMMGEGTFSCPKGQCKYRDRSRDSFRLYVRTYLTLSLSFLLSFDLTDVYYVQMEAGEPDNAKPSLEVLQPVLDQIIALTSPGEPSGAEHPLAKPLLQLTYRQVISSSSHQGSQPKLSSVPFPSPSASEASSDKQPVTSICGLTDAAVHLAENVYYDVLASRAPAHAGSTHVAKVKWVRQTVEQQKADRKRRKGRDPSEYQGRGGRGADDGITKQVNEQASETKEDQELVVGFFESHADQDGEDNDDE